MVVLSSEAVNSAGNAALFSQIPEVKFNIQVFEYQEKPMLVRFYNLEILPVFLAPARPMKELWKIRPYLGVLPLVLRALWRDIVTGQSPM